jgi:hypothetical protein
MRREVHSNYRLIVTPTTPTFVLSTSHDTAKAQLDDMAAAIRRHVDHVGSVNVAWDTRSVCSFCGREWEVVTFEDLITRRADYEGCVVGEPVCCTEAAEAFRAEHVRTPGETGGRR